MFQTSQIATIKQLIEIQYGISILHSIAIDKDPDSCISYIKLQGKAPTRKVVIATAKSRYFSPAAEYFIATVKEQYQTASV